MATLTSPTRISDFYIFLICSHSPLTMQYLSSHAMVLTTFSLGSVDPNLCQRQLIPDPVIFSDSHILFRYFCHSLPLWPWIKASAHDWLTWCLFCFFFLCPLMKEENKILISSSFMRWLTPNIFLLLEDNKLHNSCLVQERHGIWYESYRDTSK